MTALQARMQASLESRRRKGMLRALTVRSPTDGDLVDFSSNDYLSFSASPHLQRRYVDLVEQTTPTVLGPSSSRLLDGNTSLHRELESRLAEFFCGPAALLFNSGYDANVGLWSTLCSDDDWVLYDELIHASTHDGMRASRAKPIRRIPLRHNSPEDLRDRFTKILEVDPAVKAGRASVFVAVETLYSMDGDVSPLAGMADVIEEMLPHGNGHLVVDEAHSTGIYGPFGRGLTCSLGLASRVLIRLHTFGKAAACSGAVLICPPIVREYLINYARPLIYSTVMPRLNVLAIGAAIDEFESDRRAQAAEHLQYLSGQLMARIRAVLDSRPSQPPPISLPTQLLASTLPSPLPPIIPLLTARPRELSAHLVSRGYLVRPIVYPTVPKGSERVRVCLHAGNTVRQVQGLVQEVEVWLDTKERSAQEASARL